MQITTNITLDVKHPGIPPVIDAVQHDENTRYVEAEIMDGGVAWEIPDGAVGFVGISKPDGTYAYYEYDAEGNPAVEASGNRAKFILVPEALAAAGVAKGGLSFYNAAGDKLTTFAFSVRIQPSAVPDDAVASSDYFNLLTVEIAKAIAAAESVMGMTASAETLPSASEATAEVTEAGGKLNLHLGIPAGPQGPAGKPGEQGPEGPQGPAGAPGPNEITGETATTLTGLLAGDGTNIRVAVAGEDYLEPASIPAPTYTYGGKDLSQIYSAAELHTKIAAGDYEGINMGDYWPIALTGTYHDYADDADKTFTNAVVELEFMPYFYGQYGDTQIPNHILVCSRDCLPTALKMRSANETWYDTAATNPMLGSHLYQTLNNAENGIIKLVEQTELGPYIYTGPNGKGMLFFVETKAAGATTATGWGWGDRGNLFLPTEREVWGQDIWSEHTWGGGGGALQWPIFAGSRRHIIKGLGNGGSRYGWWCISSLAGSAIDFCAAHHNGVAARNSASSKNGVPLCFLII